MTSSPQPGPASERPPRVYNLGLGLSTPKKVPRQAVLKDRHFSSHAFNKQALQAIRESRDEIVYVR